MPRPPLPPLLTLRRRGGVVGQSKSLPDKPHRYGCLMLMISDPVRKTITDWIIENVPDCHLGLGGRELRPHCTVKFGLQEPTEDVLPRLKEFLGGRPPISFQLTGLKLFTSGYGKWKNEDGEVLYVEVDSPDLHKLNAEISAAFDCHDTYPEYKPHVTLAYLTSEAAPSYLKEQPPFLNTALVLDELVYSSAEGVQEIIKLNVLPNLGIKMTSPPIRPSPFYGRKALLPYSVKNWFQECPRDEEGHCKPKGEGDEGGEEEKLAKEDSSKEPEKEQSKDKPKEEPKEKARRIRRMASKIKDGVVKARDAIKAKVQKAKDKAKAVTAAAKAGAGAMVDWAEKKKLIDKRDGDRIKDKIHGIRNRDVQEAEAKQRDPIANMTLGSTFRFLQNIVPDVVAYIYRRIRIATTGVDPRDVPVGKSLDYFTKAEERKDKQGHRYCVEPGQGIVPCNPQAGGSSSSAPRKLGGESSPSYKREVARADRREQRKKEREARRQTPEGKAEDTAVQEMAKEISEDVAPGAGEKARESVTKWGRELLGELKSRIAAEPGAMNKAKATALAGKVVVESVAKHVLEMGLPPDQTDDVIEAGKEALTDAIEDLGEGMDEPDVGGAMTGDPRKPSIMIRKILPTVTAAVIRAVVKKTTGHDMRTSPPKKTAERIGEGIAVARDAMKKGVEKGKVTAAGIKAGAEALTDWAARKLNLDERDVQRIKDRINGYSRESLEEFGRKGPDTLPTSGKLGPTLRLMRAVVPELVAQIYRRARIATTGVDPRDVPSRRTRRQQEREAIQQAQQQGKALFNEEDLREEADKPFVSDGRIYTREQLKKEGEEIRRRMQAGEGWAVGDRVRISIANGKYWLEGVVTNRYPEGIAEYREDNGSGGVVSFDQVYPIKALSWLDNSTGGALVPPPKMAKKQIKPFRSNKAISPPILRPGGFGDRAKAQMVAELLGGYFPDRDEKSLSGYEVKMEERKDKRGNRYCIEPGKGRVPCPKKDEKKETKPTREGVEGSKVPQKEDATVSSKIDDLVEQYEKLRDELNSLDPEGMAYDQTEREISEIQSQLVNLRRKPRKKPKIESREPTPEEVRAVHNPETGRQSVVDALSSEDIQKIKNGVTFTADEIEDLSDAVHIAWMNRERSLPGGGRSSRRHLMVPYDKLSEEDKEKDRAFVREVVASMRPKDYWGGKEQPFYRPGPNPTVDTVVTRTGENGPEVLLIRRKEGRAEGGKWALPGGFVDTDAGRGEMFKPSKETPQDAALRELTEESGLDLNKIKDQVRHVGTFDKRGRDPRDNAEAWAVSDAFSINLPPEMADAYVEGRDDADRAEWVPVSQLAERDIAFDHRDILKAAGFEESSNPNRVTGEYLDDPDVQQASDGVDQALSNLSRARNSDDQDEYEAAEHQAEVAESIYERAVENAKKESAGRPKKKPKPKAPKVKPRKR